ncbi:hypothetical protein QOT17_008596 [Balamuthia mandrillaris]
MDKYRHKGADTCSPFSLPFSRTLFLFLSNGSASERKGFKKLKFAQSQGRETGGYRQHAFCEAGFPTRLPLPHFAVAVALPPPSLPVLLLFKLDKKCGETKTKVDKHDFFPRAQQTSLWCPSSSLFVGRVFGEKSKPKKIPNMTEKKWRGKKGQQKSPSASPLL